MKLSTTQQRLPAVARPPARPALALAALAALFLGSLDASLLAQEVPPAMEFLRGDVNADGWVSMADAVMIRRYLFNGAMPPACLDAADADDNEQVQFTDSIRILLNLFPNRAADWGTSQIPPPYLTTGPDETGSERNPDLGCAAYEVVPAEVSADILRIGIVEAAPGEEISVPVFLTNEVHIDGIQLVIRYDPAAFTPRSGTIHNEALDLNDAFYGLLVVDDTPGFLSVQAHPDDGLLTVGIVGSLLHQGAEVPPGNETLLFRLRGTVSPSVEVGSAILLEPTNGPDGIGVKPPLMMRNELTYQGTSRLVTTLPRTVPGRIGIVDDVTFFIRGDANGDLKVDVSDAVSTLFYLFAGGAQPTCQDAADANDNGVLEMADAITTLEFLFDGGAPLPFPGPEPGGDPSPDSLPRCRR